MSAFCFTFAAICSIDADASSAAAACSVAPCETCSDEEASCWLPDATFCAASAVCPIVSRRRSVIWLTTSTRSLISSSFLTDTSVLRSPSATADTAWLIFDSPLDTSRAIQKAPATAISSAMIAVVSNVVRADAYSAAESAFALTSWPCVMPTSLASVSPRRVAILRPSPIDSRAASSLRFCIASSRAWSLTAL